MTSKEYRAIIAVIIRNSLRKAYPNLVVAMGIRHGMKINQHDVCNKISRAIHARMYGANVDGVDSPIWHDPNDVLPNVDASELLKGNDDDYETLPKFQSVCSSGILRRNSTAGDKS
jgi:hypothetical protein